MTCRPLPVRPRLRTFRGRTAPLPICGVATLVALAVAAATVAPARADPRIDAKQAQARQVLAEIQSLDSRLEKAIEAYDGATARLEGIRTALRVNAREMKVARGNLRTAQQRLANRLRDIYMGDESASTLEVLLGAESFDDLLNRLDTVDRVAGEDTQVLREVTRFRSEVKRREGQLRRARVAQERVVAERRAAKASVERGLAERQRLLSSIRGEIERLKAEEERRQARLARLARARLLAQENAQQQAIANAVVGAAAETPEAAVLPPSRYGGVVGIAMQYLGIPYQWGGASPAGFDCSGFVMYVFAQVGISLPHQAAAQYGYGVPVPQDQLEPGDLVFFDGLGHVGIYIGGGQFIHSPHTGDVVKISSLSESWYAATYVGAKRII